MKAIQLTTLMLLLASISINGYADDKKTVKSKINSATVFFQGAELTHSASANLTKGENEIYIEGLSPNIDKNTLKIKTTNGVIVSASEFSIDYLSENKASGIHTKKMQDSIAFCQKQMEQIRTDVKTTTNLLDILQKGTDKNVSGSEKGLGIDELIKTMDYYQLKASELQKKQLEYNEKINEYNSTILRLQKQVSQESVKNSKTSGVLKLTLSSPAITACNLSISYYTAAASWTPFYAINIESTDKPIKIVAKSKVRQTTGLDWNKVKLTLSTSIPSNGKVAPLFRAWFLDFYRPEVQNRLISSKQLKLADRASGLAMQNAYSYNMSVSQAQEESEEKTMLYIVDGVEVDAGYAQSLDQSKIKDMQILTDAASTTDKYGSRASNGVVQITLKSNMDDFIVQTENELNTIYNIDLPYSIPGNGKEQAIDLLTKETNAEYKYYCAPKLDLETYLLAEISNWQKLNLLSGEASVTYDGTYVGETYIDARSTHKKLTLTLGTDKRVIVKREKMQDYSSTKFLGNDTKQVFTYKLTVRNNQNKPVQMTLKDQYPRSTHKNIEVELSEKDTTPWSFNVEDLGVITWEHEIKAGEIKEYLISYSVKYPKNSRLNF